MRAGQTNDLTFLVREDCDQRLDIWLSGRLDLSRSQLKKLIDRGLVLVNNLPCKGGHRLQLGDEVAVSLPKIEEPELKAQPIPIKIVYEDESLAVINKPKGLVVHPGAGNRDGTLVNALLFQIGQLAGGDQLRPGIVHRLDKDTSGLMLVAKTEESYEVLKKQFQARLVQRRYLALVQGVVASEQGIIDRPLGRHHKNRKKMAIQATGRQALTGYFVQERFHRHSLLLCSLITGRTHQIRVHLAGLHHPIVGDQLYGFKTNNLGAASQMLESVFLGFQHPAGHFLEFQIEPSTSFKEIVRKARLMR